MPQLEAGAPIQVVMTKWGGRPHWEFQGVYLGADAFGDWLGFPTGTFYRRPGMEFRAGFDCVTLVPAAPHLATFYGSGSQLPVPNVAVYVDITTPAVWDGSTLRAVDLDLDVIRRQDGSVYVDDEDEFAEHQVAFGYPPDVVALAESSCREVRAAVEAREAPYDDLAPAVWVERLGATTPP